MSTRPAPRAPTVLALAAGAAVTCGLGCGASPTADPNAGEGSDPGAVGRECPAAGAALGQQAAALSVVDRAMIGSPADFAADATLTGREGSLRDSRRERRRVAWDVAARVLAPVPLTGALAEGQAALPSWQTWHNKDDLTRIFRRLYPELAPDERTRRGPFDDAALDAAWRWNDGAIADFEEWTGERLAAYRDAFDTAPKLAGAGGVYRVAYSPAASRHLLESYGSVLGCRESDARVETPPPLAPPAVAGCGGATFAPACLASQFPASAVLVKASWQRLDAGGDWYAFDTSAASLEQKLSPEGAAAWGTGDRVASPGEGEMYTLELPNGNRFGLTGLHIMTKELEHWVWVTLWWSDRPDEDFGADRPADFPAPFDHYKLCSVVSFGEGDADPEGGFAVDAPSLAAALAVTDRGVGGPSWCSNPYIEEGDGNASTNCVGCHQHAGTRLRSEDILADAAAFPDYGRTEQRESFPSDYVFSVRRGDDLGAMFVETEDHYRQP